MFEKNVLVRHSKSSSGKTGTGELEAAGKFSSQHGFETQCGELIVMRCTTGAEVISTEEFQPCTHCYGFLQHNELWRHIIKRLVLLKGLRTVRKMKVRNTDIKQFATMKQIALAILEAN